MVTEDEKAQIRLCGTRCAKHPGFRSRRPQSGRDRHGGTTRWPHAVRRGSPADGEHIAVVEAGTGTGKSFGAAVPTR
jgi:ATP-dependent DNA helicase DinG